MKNVTLNKNMRNSIVSLLLIFVSVLFCTGEIVQAVGTTSYTSTVDENGRLIRTQDAYLPMNTITSLGLSTPEDLYFDSEDNLYIADTGNRRIVKYDTINDELLGILEYEGFASPKGVFVTDAGDIYVADSSAKSVFRFDKDFELIEIFEKPTTPIFEDTNFEPSKIAVDNVGNMYILGEGVYSGIIQISQENEFLGFFAVNQTTLTPMEAFQRLIFSKEQIEKLAQTVPNTFSNVFIDGDGIVYTTTMGSEKNSEIGVKKHNTNGVNMLKNRIISEEDSTDVYVDTRGNMYVSSNSGFISVYSKDGELIFRFGSPAGLNDIAGLFTRLPAIAVDSNFNVWAVDGEKGYLQSFAPTEYAETIYRAMDYYQDGEYENSKQEWNNALRLNQMSVLAHDGVGKTLLQEQDYEQAIVHFEVAGNRALFSEAFWEVRNNWLQQYLPTILIALVILFVAGKIVNHFKKEEIKLLKKRIRSDLSALPILKDIYFGRECSKKPFDTFYEIRKDRAGSVLGATFIYITGFIVYMLYQTNKGYIYQFTKIEDMDINAIVIGFFLIIGLFILCNYLITSINDGLGTFKQIYLVPAYSAIPIITCMIIVIGLSHILVENEAFILTLTMQIGTIWTLGTLFIGLWTLHDYTFKETIRSIIYTILFMGIIAMIGILITIMWEQLWDFVFTIGKEILRNVL